MQAVVEGMRLQSAAQYRAVGEGAEILAAILQSRAVTLSGSIFFCLFVLLLLCCCCCCCCLCELEQEMIPVDCMLINILEMRGC